jgi:hypothetical protein
VSNRPDDLKRKPRAFLEAERVHQRERPFEEEKLHHEDMLAGTNRLRELRLAREVALRAAKAVVKAELPK